MVRWTSTSTATWRARSRRSSEGWNDLQFFYTDCSRDLCVMLCPVGDTWLVTGEDYNSGPYGACYWSNSCECSTAFTDNNLTICVCYDGCPPNPIEETSWGRIRTTHR